MPSSPRLSQRGVAAATQFATIALFIKSICRWASLQRSTYPKPAGVPSSGKSTSAKKGYSPWSYRPAGADAHMGPSAFACCLLPAVSFSVEKSTVSPTNFT